jgi:hypothetical protein
MKSLIKGSLAAALAAVATAVSADYLAWRVSGSENRDYSYAQIYYASSYNDLNNSKVYGDGSTALKNYLDNRGTSTSELSGEFSPTSDKIISKGAMDTGASFLVDTSEIGDYGSDGYSFYVLLFNAEGKARYVTNLGSGGSTIATYSDLANNYVDALTAEALGYSAMVAEGFVIPEPGSGLLLLVGSAMMLLRRKRAG